MLRILIDVGHPAHVHLFKHFVWEIQKRGADLLFTARDKENTIDLLKAYGLPYCKIGPHYHSLLQKAYGMLKNDFKIFRITRKFNPNILLSHGSIYAAQVSFLLNKPHISMEDTGNMEQIRLYKPFTQAILTPSCLKKNLGKKQIRYLGYHELAYLYPSYFQADRHVLDELNIKENEKFMLFRFVAWGATHDIGKYGLSPTEKSKIINELSNYSRIFISSESELPEDLRRYKICVSPEKIHSVLYYATVVVSEGAKIAGEAAVLGVPNIFINAQSLSCLEELKNKYQLVCNYSNPENLKEKIYYFLKTHNIKQKWAEKRRLMLQEKIDVTKLLVWFVENYPKSARIIKQDKCFQLQFK